MADEKDKEPSAEEQRVLREISVLSNWRRILWRVWWGAMGTMFLGMIVLPFSIAIGGVILVIALACGVSSGIGVVAMSKCPASGRIYPARPFPAVIFCPNCGVRLREDP